MVVANFPANTKPADVTVLFIGGLQADVLKISDVSRCHDPYGDCNFTRLTILAPAVDPPGAWSGSLSVNGQKRMDLSLIYFTPCKYQRFCEADGKIVDKHLLQTRVPTSKTCDPQYCVNLANVKDPTIVSFFPSEGPSTGGTIVSVRANNLPAFATSDLAIEVGSAASVVTISPESVSQAAGSSTTSSNGVFTFKMPPVSGGVFNLLSETSVKLKVALGMNIRSVEFKFQYTPVISGPAQVSSFYPTKAFPTVDVEVKVQLTNFIKLTSLAPEQVHVQFENSPGNLQDYKASSIQASSYTGTLVSFRTGGHLAISGTTKIHVYYSVHGISRAGSFNFEVLPAPTPSIFSMFPLRGRANVVLNHAVTVQYVDPVIAERATWTIRLSGLTGLQVSFLATPTLTVQSTAGCTRRHCAKYLVQYEVPQNAVPLDGGDVTVTIAADTDIVQFVLPFDADDTPTVESVDPTSLSIENTASTLIKIYLKNVDQTFCSNFATCQVTFGGIQGTATAAFFANKILTVSIQPPAVGAGGLAPGVISDKGISIKFDYTFVAPPASLEPIDGACAGGDVINFKVLGWGEVVSSANSIKVQVGDKEGKVTKIVQSVATPSFSQTVLEVTSPILSSKGIYTGIISFGEKQTSFVYECFDAPTVLASPAAATLDGRTASTDGKSIALYLTNFPKIATTADVLVRFGDTVCNGLACSVVSFANSVSGVSLVVIPPKVKLSANVMVSVTYTGVAEPPKDGDPGKVYIRAAKTAKTAFSLFRPNPVVISAKWCAQCVEGSRTCISNGKCGGKITPKANAMGASGTGVITVVVDNFPQVKVDLRSGRVFPPAKVEVSFGSYFGTIQRTLYSDEIRSAFELSLRSPVPIGKNVMDLRVYEDLRTPISFSALQDISFFDESIGIVCRGVCQGPSAGSTSLDEKLIFVVKNLAVVSASDFVVSFGDEMTLDLTIVSSAAANTTLSVSVPPYIRSFEIGQASVELSIAYASDKVPIASTLYTYYAPPRFSSVRFSTTGTSIDCVFDAPTDRAGMTADITSCENVLESTSVAKLGMGAMCVWKSDVEMTIFLGDIKALDNGIAIRPNDVLSVRPNSLKSLNRISSFSSATSIIARPLIVSPPEVSVKGTDTIDPCSSLEVRVSVLSPRPASVSWTCLNDPDFSSYLATVSSSTLFISTGTSPMTTFPKTYVIEINVVDFLGVSAPPKIFRVLKKGTAVPQMEFNPPTVETLRNKEILIKGETVFSACPVEETDVTFSWRQVSGPTQLPASLLSTQIPQLLIPPNTLPAGSVYQLGLFAAMSDVSQSSESLVTVCFSVYTSSIDTDERTSISNGNSFTDAYAHTNLHVFSALPHLHECAPRWLMCH